MEEEYFGYKKFADLESAEIITDLLKEAGIEYRLLDNNQHYVKVVGYQQIDLAITLNLKGEDFVKADKLLEEHYKKVLDSVDTDYYLFEFTEQELKNVVLNPYEWGSLDVLLATKLLKEKGIEYDATYIENRKQDTLEKLAATKKVPLYILIIGYALTALFPMAGIAMGLSILYNRNILPDGRKLYAHPAKDRTHGQVMLIVSITWTCIIILSTINKYN